MGWKETEQRELKKLPANARQWVAANVNLERSNDLQMRSRSELLAMFPDKNGLNDRKCLKTLIWQQWLKIKAREAQPVKGNLRSFWYGTYEVFCIDKDLLESDLAVPEENLMEAVFQENPRWAGLFNESIKGPADLERELGSRSRGAVERIWRSGRESYLQSLVSICFDEFVKNAVFRFQGAFMFNDPRESFRILGHDKARYIFFTEKEGLWWLCKEIHNEYSITVVASKGEPGLLAMEYLYDALRHKKVGTLEIGAVTDYDPWGYNIAEGFAEKLGYSIFYGEGKVSNTILNGSQKDLEKFFTPEEIERGKRDLRKYSKYKKKQVDEWMGKTQGINKEPYGIHVDLAQRDKLKAEVARWLKEVMGAELRRR